MEAIWSPRTQEASSFGSLLSKPISCLTKEKEKTIKQSNQYTHFLLQPLSEEDEYYEKELVLKSLAWVPLKWLHSNQERAMWFSFNVSPGQEHLSTQIFSIFHSQYKIQVESILQFWRSPLQLHFVALVFYISGISMLLFMVALVASYHHLCESLEDLPSGLVFSL